MTCRQLRCGALFVAAAVFAPGRSEAGVLITQGSTINHVGDVPAELKQALPADFGGAAVGFHYSYFGVFWLDLWTWDGTFCLYAGKKYMALTPAEAAARLDKPESELSTPFLYRFPLGLMILGGLATLGVLGALAERRSKRKTVLLLEDPKYQHAVALLYDHVRKEEAALAARQAAGAAAAGPGEGDVGAAAFEAAVVYLTNEGVPREEAETNLQRVLAATAEAAVKAEVE